MLNGRRYHQNTPFTSKEMQLAKDNGFVIAYETSDGFVRLNGAILDEIKCHGKNKVHICETGSVDYGNKDTKWIMCKTQDGIKTEICQTNIPHEKFILKGENYYNGIVFSICSL